jgi:group I intron endonuclease
VISERCAGYTDVKNIGRNTMSAPFDFSRSAGDSGPDTTALRWLIYIAVNRANDKIYVGYAGNLPRRMSRHRADARRGSKFPFHSAIRKHGWDKFRFFEVARFAAEAEAKAAEKREISQRRAQDRRIGYNVADGGDGIGSEGAKAVHRRPLFRKLFQASMPDRHAKAQATKRVDHTNQLAAALATATKRARGIDKLAATKAAATRARRRENGPSEISISIYPPKPLI